MVSRKDPVAFVCVLKVTTHLSHLKRAQMC